MHSLVFSKRKDNYFGWIVLDVIFPLIWNNCSNLTGFVKISKSLIAINDISVPKFGSSVVIM